jgi:GNAT superfamily N-acetyltransferase
LSPIQWPDGFVIEQLTKNHSRAGFNCGVDQVNEWLQQRALQAQNKRLSTTRVLLEKPNTIAGYYTLAMGQVNFDELPNKIVRKLPKTLLPAITLTCLGVDKRYQGHGLGERILARALRDCHHTGQLLPFVAVFLDCLTLDAKKFYQRYDFEELQGHPMKLYLSWKLLDAMIR